jgi:putative nucleotidyltransferase with HDIG domain
LFSGKPTCIIALYFVVVAFHFFTNSLKFRLFFRGIFVPEATFDKEKRRILIQRIQELPTLPSTISKIIELVESKSSTSEDLARVISKDQSISSLILKLVNSAFYGHLRQISSISHAIVILGYTTVRTMALGVSIFSSSPGKKAAAFDMDKFWIHSIGVATITRRIATHSPARDGLDMESVFLSGLLHDIGKVIFAHYFNKEYNEVVESAVKNQGWIGDSESAFFGLNHAEAGYYLAQKWQFPSTVISAIKCHHDAMSCDGEAERAMACMVNLADYLCRKAVIGSGGDNEERPLDEQALSFLGISHDTLMEIVGEVEKDREMIESLTLDRK